MDGVLGPERQDIYDNGRGDTQKPSINLDAGRESLRQEGRDGGDLATSPRRQTPQPQSGASPAQRQTGPPAMVVQGDFRKVSGISTEIFRQIENVENDHDATTAAALEAVERRGEMLVRILDPRHVGRNAQDVVKKFLALQDAKYSVYLVEIVKRPGQTLGLYIREGNGHDRSDGVFISRIALESAVYNSGCLKVGDEILAVNLVDVTRMSLDDVVIIMSIPRRLVLATRQRKAGKGGVASPHLQPRTEHKPPPVVVMKRGDLREDEERDDREDDLRRRGDGRDMRDSRDIREHMPQSRSRLGLTGLGSHHDLDSNGLDSNGLGDLYYNSRPEERSSRERSQAAWSYQPPPPPVITEQPKAQHYQPYDRGYPKTLESLAEKVHAFYGGPVPQRRLSVQGPMRSGLLTPTTPTGQSHYGIGGGRRTPNMPRSGSDQHLPRVEYSTLRSSLKSSQGYSSRYGRSDMSSRQQFTSGTLTRRHRPVDYASDSEATCSMPPRTSYYYYRQGLSTPASSRTSTLSRSHVPAVTTPTSGLRSNSLPRDHRGRTQQTSRHHVVRFESQRVPRESSLSSSVLHDQEDSDGAVSAPELPVTRRERGRLPSSPSVFTADEYRAWLQRTPSTSAIYERIRASREIVQQQRAARFSCSAENINLLDRREETSSSGYSSYRPHVTSTLDRHQYSSSRSSASASERSASSLRRMRHLLELEARHIPNPSPARHQPADLRSRYLEINPAEFIKYKMDKPSMMGGESAEPGVSGLLWVHLLAGRGLRSTTSSSAATTPSTPQGPPTIGSAASLGLRDLYCVLECDRVHKARTVVRTGDLVFDWDETFELDLVDNRELDLLIYSWDPQYRHKLCYKGSVHLASLLRECPMHQLALKMEPRGTLYVRLRHTDPHTAFRRRGAQLPLSLSRKGGLLHGTDLETVVARESVTGGVPGGVATSVTLATQAQTPMPMIVRRCVEEIERRGLDIIGLYRLCGSATKKRILREAFERNSRTVDLSPDNVPDINVITGVLKDYLRELPEPLFTKCLYQMMVDALSVCLPDDPVGNAKLMFSILDCLPKVNRCTLIYLMDHLALVASQSDRNKMTPQNLAVCFGPVLMLQSQEGLELQFNQPISVLKYLLEIWPSKSAPECEARAGGRASPPRCNKLSVLLPQTVREVTAHLSPPTCRISSVPAPQATSTPTIIGGPWSLRNSMRAKQIVVSSPDTPTSESSPDDVIHKASGTSLPSGTLRKTPDKQLGGFGQTQNNSGTLGRGSSSSGSSYARNSGTLERNSGAFDRNSTAVDRNSGSFGNTGTFDRNSGNGTLERNPGPYDRSSGNLERNSGVYSSGMLDRKSGMMDCSGGMERNSSMMDRSPGSAMDKSPGYMETSSGSTDRSPGLLDASSGMMMDTSPGGMDHSPGSGILPSNGKPDGLDVTEDQMLQTPTSSTTTEDSRKEATGREADIEASDDDKDDLGDRDKQF